MARKLIELTQVGSLQASNQILINDGSIDARATLAQVFDLIMPVGFMYTQFPGKPSPVTLGWPGTWIDKSSEYAGAFFRAEGSTPYGSAATFEGGAQEDAFQGHAFGDSSKATHPLKRGTSGSYANIDVTDAGVDTYWGSNYPGHTLAEPITDGTNDVPRTSSETRPYNYTVRIWERTA